MNQEVEERELTHEELVARKEEMLTFYKESLPYLQAQFEYEDLLAKIDEARFKRAQYQIQYAMMMNPPQEEESSPEALRETIQQEQKERKLKKP
jgi:hypothetical protein